VTIWNVLNHSADRLRWNYANCHYQHMQSQEGIGHSQYFTVFNGHFNALPTASGDIGLQSSLRSSPSTPNRC